MNIDKLTGITVDSRKVKPGYAFVAISGNNIDGHLFVEQAIKNGAILIIHQKPLAQNPNIAYLRVEDPRIALFEYAKKIYAKQPKFILGVTGTSGKSSCVHFVREILKALGTKAVSIGTLGVIGDYELESSLTTPATEELHQIMAKLVELNINYVAMECSSHGIDQKRLSGIEFAACAFTNFSRDHLDYHANMEEYFAAKLKLFDIMQKGVAVLNKDIEQFSDLYAYCKDKHKIITFGKNIASDVRIVNITNSPGKQIVEFQVEGKTYINELNLTGEFQVYNLATAIALLKAVNVNMDDVFAVLNNIETVPGRMELVGFANEAGIFIDYAHKPEALEQALLNLRKVTTKRVVVLFGCGGNRDAGKRQIMGEIAAKLADFSIITDDNPRDEEPSKIRKEILQNFEGEYIEIADREAAINWAINNLFPGDNLLIAGKGHENYQIIGDQKINFSDKQKVQSILRIS